MLRINEHILAWTKWLIPTNIWNIFKCIFLKKFSFINSLKFVPKGAIHKY